MSFHLRNISSKGKEDLLLTIIHTTRWFRNKMLEIKIKIHPAAVGSMVIIIFSAANSTTTIKNVYFAKYMIFLYTWIDKNSAVAVVGYQLLLVSLLLAYGLCFCGRWCPQVCWHPCSCWRPYLCRRPCCRCQHLRLYMCLMLLTFLECRCLFCILLLLVIPTVFCVCCC